MPGACPQRCDAGISRQAIGPHHHKTAVIAHRHFRAVVDLTAAGADPEIPSHRLAGSIEALPINIAADADPGVCPHRHAVARGIHRHAGHQVISSSRISSIYGQVTSDRGDIIVELGGDVIICILAAILPDDQVDTAIGGDIRVAVIEVWSRIIRVRAKEIAYRIAVGVERLDHHRAVTGIMARPAEDDKEIAGRGHGDARISPVDQRQGDQPVDHPGPAGEIDDLPRGGNRADTRFDREYPGGADRQLAFVLHHHQQASAGQKTEIDIAGEIVVVINGQGAGFAVEQVERPDGHGIRCEHPHSHPGHRRYGHPIFIVILPGYRKFAVSRCRDGGATDPQRILGRIVHCKIGHHHLSEKRGGGDSDAYYQP